MGQRKQLSEAERVKIDILAKANPEWTFKRIAELIGRSKQSVSRYLKSPETYNTKKRSGRPKVTTEREDREIVRKATGHKLSGIRIKYEMGLDCSVRTVQRRLKSNANLKYGKHHSKPKLTKQHKLNRLEFAREFVSFSLEQWSRIVWSDGKKFNLDGPDSLHNYWYDLRKEKQIFSKRNFGGGSVMVWAAFGLFGTTPIAFCETKMDSSSYQDILEEFLLPEAPLISSGDYLFMHDNAPIHRSDSTKRWLDRNGVKTIEWPPLSPDLNPIENLWGWLTRIVYAQGRQFSSVTELKSAIVSAWSEVPKDLLISLISSMKTRMLKVIESKGDSIDY